jgi:hypothetical protein
MHHLHRDVRDMKFSLYDEDDYSWSTATSSSSSPSPSSILSSSATSSLPYKQIPPTLAATPTIPSSSASGDNNNTNNNCNNNSNNDNDSNGINSPPCTGRNSLNLGVSPPVVLRTQISKGVVRQDSCNDGCIAMEVDKDKRIAIENNDVTNIVIPLSKGSEQTDKDKVPTDNSGASSAQTIHAMISNATQLRDQPKRMTKRLRLESLQAYMTPEQKEEQQKKLRSNFEEVNDTKIKVVKKRAPRKDFWHQVKPEESHP